jgi:hypothetical protein
MDNMALRDLIETWTQAKKAELMAVETRRKVEDEITSIVELNPANEGTINLDVDRYRVKIVNRLTRKVDSEMIQEIAAETGLEAHLSTLFRWKADIDAKTWKACSPEITTAFNKAITTTAGRPSYSITIEE